MYTIRYGQSRIKLYHKLFLPPRGTEGNVLLTPFHFCLVPYLFPFRRDARGSAARNKSFD